MTSLKKISMRHKLSTISTKTVEAYIATCIAIMTWMLINVDKYLRRFY